MEEYSDFHACLAVFPASTFREEGMPTNSAAPQTSELSARLNVGQGQRPIITRMKSRTAWTGVPGRWPG